MKLNPCTFAIGTHGGIALFYLYFNFVYDFERPKKAVGDAIGNPFYKLSRHVHLFFYGYINSRII